MSWQNKLAKIGFRDRKQECDLFRAMLHQKTAHRGMVIHSNGQGGAGKSTLLKMFENEYKNADLSLPTELIYFTPDSLSLIDWLAILDSTVEQLGKAHFAQYTQLREAASHAARHRGASTAGDDRIVYVYETHIHQVQGSVHTGSGDIRTGNVEASGELMPQFHHLGRVDEVSPSPEEVRQQLTRVFLAELDKLPNLSQLVWLIDAAEKLDPATQEWLIELLWGIAQRKTKRLILVVAGRNRLRYEPHWVDYVVDLEVGFFTIDVVTQIILEYWPEHDERLCIMLAEVLLEKTKGEPQQTITVIERGYNRRVFQ